jgi:hypothetical protein
MALGWLVKRRNQLKKEQITHFLRTLRKIWQRFAYF